LADFSGYIAADELYDGPFCYLSLVDAKSQRRIVYEVLDRSPEKDDVACLLSRFKTELVLRGLTLQGVTTDGSALYPEAIGALFPGVRHQVCRFHMVKEINTQVLRALAGVRRQLRARIPARPRGRPTKASRRICEKIERLEALHKDLFDHRYLFVRRNLKKSERDTLERISKPFPELRQLREIVEETYRLYDGRCKTVTAVKKLEVLRDRLKRMKKLSKSMRRLASTNAEKSLAYLDVKDFPGTSNAVERGNRRHRKMQKSVYRVRTLEHIRQRIALDMQRERGSRTRFQIIELLHDRRSG
jgi:transposase-like protein